MKRCHVCNVAAREGAQLEEVHACIYCRLDAPTARARAERAEARVAELEDGLRKALKAMCDACATRLAMSENRKANNGEKP